MSPFADLLTLVAEFLVCLKGLYLDTNTLACHLHEA